MILIKTPESSTNDDNNGSDSSMSPIVYRPPSFDTTINAVLPESPTIMEHHKHNKENNVNTSDAIYEKNDANNDIHMKGIILSTPNLHPSSSSLSLSCEGDEIACISGTVLEHIESMFKKKDMMKANDILRAFDRPTIRGLLHLYEVIHDKRWTDRELGNALANEMNRQHIRCSSRIGHILGKSKKEFSTHSTSDSSISSTFMSSDDTSSHHSSSPIFSSRTMSPILPIHSSPATSSLNITHYLSTIAKLTPELPNAVDSNYNYSELAPFLHDGQREEEHFDNLVKEVFGETFPDQDEQNDRYEKNKIPVKESYSYLKTKEGGCHNQPSEQSSSRPSKKRGRPRKNEHEHPTEEMDSGAARTKTNNVANHSALTYVSKPIIDSVPIPKVTILNCQKKDYWLDNAENYLNEVFIPLYHAERDAENKLLTQPQKENKFESFAISSGLLLVPCMDMEQYWLYDEEDEVLGELTLHDESTLWTKLLEMVEKKSFSSGVTIPVDYDTLKIARSHPW